MTVLDYVLTGLGVAALAVILWLALLAWGPEPRGHDPEDRP